MLLRTYGVWCDGARNVGAGHAQGCPRLIGNESSSKEARAFARASGWKHIVGSNRYDSRDLSPQCAAQEGVLS